MDATAAANLVPVALKMLLDTGQDKVQLTKDGVVITAYWVASMIRIDLKGCTPQSK